MCQPAGRSFLVRDRLFIPGISFLSPSFFVTFSRLLHAADFSLEFQLRETAKIAKDAKK